MTDPIGINRHGCWTMCVTDDGETRVFALTERLGNFLRKRAGEDATPDEIGEMVEWARTAKPGAVEAFFQVVWLIAVDPLEDRGELLDVDGWEDPRVDAYAVWRETAKAAGLLS